MTKRDRVIMMKTERPKRVTLPNGRTFITRYKRVTRAHLPANVCLARPYKERAPAKGRLRNGSKLLKLDTKVAKAPIT